MFSVTLWLDLRFISPQRSDASAAVGRDENSASCETPPSRRAVQAAVTVCRTCSSITAGSSATRALTIRSSLLHFTCAAATTPAACDCSPGWPRRTTLPTDRSPSDGPPRRRAGSATACKRLTTSSSRSSRANGVAAGDADAAVEPAQLGLALGVDVVIDVENLAAEVALLIEQFRQRRRSPARSSPTAAAPATPGYCSLTRPVNSSICGARPIRRCD